MDKDKKQKMLLLGGEGFIGRNLAQYFSQSFTCFSAGEAASLFSKREDVFVLANPYEDAIENDYTVIIHLIDNKKCDIAEYVREEEKLVKNIRLNSQNHLILFSSAIIYANPDSEYGMRKRFLEDFYSEYCKKNSIKLTIVRLFNTFGPFQIPYRQGSLIASLIFNHLIDKETEINFMGAERDFIYARDIPKFVEYYVVNKMTGVFDLGSGELISVGSIIQLLEKEVFKTKMKILDKELEESIISPEAKNVTQDMPLLTEIIQALQESVDFYQENKEIIRRLC